MGFWKALGYVVGGTVLGVGAVAAAPFTGGGSVLGAATLATSLAGAAGAATAAGAAGGLTGVIASEVEEEMEENENDIAFMEGEEVAEARYKSKVQKLENALKESMSRLTEDEHYFRLIVALFAVGLATAKADGEINDKELEELNEFVEGIVQSDLPTHVKNVISSLRNNPPSFNTALQYVRSLGNNIDLSMFEDVIKLVAMSDGYFDRNEEALLEAFKREAA